MSTAALPVSPTTAPPPPFIPPKDVAQEIQREIRNLNAEDEQIIMKAAASLIMLATLPGAEPHMGSCVSRLVSLLVGDYSIHVKRNACAALTAIMNTSLMLYNTVAATPDLMKGILKCLKLNVDTGLQINALAAVKFLAEHEQGLVLLEQAGLDDILLSFLGFTVEDCLEDVVDAFCSLATYERMRPALLHKGAVPKLALHLETSSSEVCIRVLLALGMICGTSVSGQCELAKTDGGVKALIKLMKSTDDDIKLIARDLFRSLTSNQEARPVVEHMMRSSPET